MTKEEAIKFLKLMRDAINNFEKYGHDKTSMVVENDTAGNAIDIAIEALSEDVEIPSDKTVVHIETYRRLYEKYVDLKNNAVKVVKCKNCRHRFYDKYNNCFMCEKHEYGESFEDDDFCSWGERKEE